MITADQARELLDEDYTQEEFDECLNVIEIMIKDNLKSRVLFFDNTSLSFLANISEPEYRKRLDDLERHLSILGYGSTLPSNAGVISGFLCVTW